MKKILVAILIATMMLLAVSTADEVTKSTTTRTTPGPDVTKSTTTTTGPDAVKSTTTETKTTPSTEPTSTTKSTTTTSSTPGFEAIFAGAGILAVTFIALRSRR